MPIVCQEFFESSVIVMFKLHKDSEVKTILFLRHEIIEAERLKSHSQ